MDEKPKRRRVSFARSTYLKARAFEKGLTALEEKISLAEARAYLLGGVRREDVDGQVYDEIDALQELRKSAIRGEMKYAEAQMGFYLREHPEKGGSPAEFVGEAVLTGDDLRYGLPAEVYDAAPSLQVYEMFMWTTVRELERLQNAPETPGNLGF